MEQMLLMPRSRLIVEADRTGGPMNLQANDSSPVEKLSPGERACLAGVLEMKSSKEIALDLGISPNSVDKKLKNAMRILGVSTRSQAARIYGTQLKLTGQPLAPPSLALVAAPPVDAKQVSGPPHVARLEEQGVLYDPFLQTATQRTFRQNLRGFNGLGVWQRVFIVIGIAVAGPLMVGSLATGLTLAQGFYLIAR
jgi:DNA-binding CsgD family transcriptional regulator